jgi:hypothetical protein
LDTQPLNSDKTIKKARMKTIIKLWLLVIWVIAVTSCSPTRAIKKCEKCFSLIDTSTTTKIVDSTFITYDTVTHVVEVTADTTIQIIQIACDSLGNATIKTSTTKKGNRSDLSTSLSNNVLSIQATCDKVVDSLQLVITNKERHRTETTTNIVKVPIAVEAKLTWWQKIKIRFGGWAFLIIALFIGYKSLSTYYKVNTPMGLILTLRRKLMR